MSFKRIPLCPGNPEDFILVETKEKTFWRRKRGRVKPARLNAGFQASSDATKIVSPAARRIHAALELYLRGISPGRLNNRISTALRGSLKEENSLKLSYLKEMEMQPDHPLHLMLKVNYTVKVSKKQVEIEIPIEKGGVASFNKLVTDYYFEAVLLSGDVSKENGLKTEGTESPLYSFEGKVKTKCILRLSIPQRNDWCVFLKLSCLEGNELAVHPKHYRMKVVGWRV